jgi:cytoskeletal protein CcmA (bactofilin family)
MSNVEATKARPEVTPVSTRQTQEMVSTLAAGMLVTGNIVSTGAVQIYGRVTGEIHVARLLICKGALVEGKITARETVIDGVFKGTIHSTSVKLQATAAVEGEIFSKSLAIEQNAQFEGAARRLDTAIEVPSAEQANDQFRKDVPVAPVTLTAVSNEQIRSGSGSVHAINSNVTPYAINGGGAAHASV